MKLTLHKQLILGLAANHGLEMRFFRKLSIDAIKRTMGRAWNRYREEEYRNDLNFVPDAFSIDPVDRSITAYEVIVTHKLEDEKLRAVVEAWFSLDCIEWDLKLITVNQFGLHSEVDLSSEWYRKWQPVMPVIEPIEEKPKIQKPPKPQPRGARSNKVFWWETC